MPATRSSQRRLKKAQPLARVLLLAMVGTATISALLGYLAGATAADGRVFTANQTTFIEGYAIGVRFLVDSEQWAADPDHSPYDKRGEPATRCAGMFYPSQQIALEGCLQALRKPDSGFRLPGPR